MKSSVLLVIGLALLILGGFGIFSGVAYETTVPHTSPEYVPAVVWGLGAMCGLGGVLPGAILILQAQKSGKKERAVMEFASWVRSYRRIGLGDLSRKLGKSEFETEKVLAEAMDKGLVHGFVDRQTGEFVAAEWAGGQMYSARCPNCGGTVSHLFMEGETPLCPYCNSVLPTEALRPT
ncbi:MAG TPA: PCI domain-containing protein [Thermoplasmata archaeon]|nr:PCI domain-containing protein [Thermoplasmata archaeon]